MFRAILAVGSVALLASSTPGVPISSAWAEYGLVPKRAMSAECPGFCIICHFGENPQYLVFELSTFGNDADASVTCGHHNACQGGCNMTMSAVDSATKILLQGEGRAVDELVRSRDGWRFVLNRDRRALQVIGCKNVPIFAHVPLSELEFSRLSPHLSALSN